MDKILCNKEEKSQHKINFDLKNMQLEDRKSWLLIKFFVKTYEINQENVSI